MADNRLQPDFCCSVMGNCRFMLNVYEKLGADRVRRLGYDGNAESPLVSKKKTTPPRYFSNLAIPRISVTIEGTLS